MYKVVKCPKCNSEYMTRGKVYFQCYRCNMAFLIEKCLVANVDEYRYTKPKKDAICECCHKPESICDCVEVIVDD